MGGGAVMGVDPGRLKAGYALLAADGSVLDAGVVPLGELVPRLEVLVRDNAVEVVALGKGTNARTLLEPLQRLGPPVSLVDEFETTRRARELYFSEHPPRGWRRLVPAGLQVPPRPIDDYAAILIARRFLAREGGRRPQR